MDTIFWPAHVVTPLESRPSLTMKRAAMKITVVSPKPANASSTEMTPVASKLRGAASATISTGILFHTNSTTSATRTM